MPATPAQLRLLPAPQPLVDRLGADFFRALPRTPGVYRMFDARGDLIYVGKAKDLRARLASYRRTHGQSRKTIRLIHSAERIEWEACDSDTAARLLENHLIRTHRPRFNRVGTWPKSARFVLLEAFSDGFRITVTGEPAGAAPKHPGPADASEVLFDQPCETTERSEPPLRRPMTTEIFGAFRGGPSFALGALGRLLWLSWHQVETIEALPRVLVVSRALRAFEARPPDTALWLDAVRDYLSGTADTLIARLVETVPMPTAPFERAFVAADFETLAGFFRQGPLRTRRLRTALAPDSTALAPEQLDDFLVLSPPTETAPAFRPPE